MSNRSLSLNNKFDFLEFLVFFVYVFYSEVLAEESNEKFWQFVNGIADLDPTTYVDSE